MIDIHSHIIPNIDDGSTSEEISIEMLRTAYESGTKVIVLTPHYYRGKFMVPLKKVREKSEEIKKVAKNNNIDLEILVGQEIYFTPALLEDLDNGEIGTINESRYMLIELNLMKFEYEYFEILHELKVRGIVPIIAHPERYREFQKEPIRINKFIEAGCLFQLNANSIAGTLGSEAKKLSEFYIKNKIYSFIGSDAHGLGKRNTDISIYQEEISKVDRIFFEKILENSVKLIQNEVVSFQGEKIEKKKKRFFNLF
ncbi:MAG: tyrosine-protein phosphatase [Sarcina sp.]